MTDNVFDIVIIGSGIAALALLEELEKDKSLKIALIEANKTINSKRVNDTVTQWHHILDECSNNGFGGTSKTWGGRCVDYNDIDFVERDLIKAQWPIVKNDLMPFYEASCQFLKIGKPVFTVRSPKKVNSTFSERNIERWSQPLRLHNSKKRFLKNSNVKFFDNHSVSHLLKNSDDNELTTVYFDNSLKKIYTKKCVIAAGGIETTRILLNSIDNEHLGKYYQGHVSGKVANIIFNNPANVKYGFDVDDDGIYTRNRYQPTGETIDNEKILNSAIWLDNLPLYDYQHGNAILSFIYLLFNFPVLSKFLAPPSIKRAIVGNPKDKNLFKHAVNCIKNLPSIFTFSLPFFIKRYLCSRKIPGFFLYSPTGKYALHFHAEQQPVKDNNISFNESGGLTINYSFTEIDLSSVMKTHHLLDKYLKDNNIGHIEFYGDDIKMKEKILAECKDGIHQIGTARMATSIKDGVVDKNLQVFNLQGVHVLSSATFPTSSQANPTFLLVVFAKRLASHLMNDLENKL